MSMMNHRRRVDVRPMWKRRRGRPRKTWAHQVELDTGLTADTAWTSAEERDAWEALYDTQLVKWFSE